jgi:hypothetical protein
MLTVIATHSMRVGLEFAKSPVMMLVAMAT